MIKLVFFYIYVVYFPCNYNLLYIESNVINTTDVYSCYSLVNQFRELWFSSIFADVYYAAGYRPTPATVNVITALLGDLCIVDSDCGVKYSRCVGGACVCKEGHAETPDRQECLGENIWNIQCMVLLGRLQNNHVFKPCLYLIL
jgi:hypothetical protein